MARQNQTLPKVVKKKPIQRTSNPKGAALVEYVVLVALLGVTAIGTVLTVGEQTRNLFDTTRTAFS